MIWELELGWWRQMGPYQVYEFQEPILSYELS